MRKLLFIIPIIFGAFCITPSFADGIDNALLGADTGGESCTSADSTEICYYPKPGGTSGNPTACANKNENDDCTSTGTQTAKCQYNGGDTLRCTAKTCKDGYHLWVTSARSKKPVKSYEDYQSNGVCVPDNWCAIQRCPDCELHKFQWKGKSATDKVCYKITRTPTQQTAQEQPTTPNTGCDLTFANGDTIENVDLGESAKPEYTDTVKLVNNTRNKIESFYQIPLKLSNKFIQNIDSFSSGYDENTPHLFDLEKVNNAIVTQSVHDALKTSAYIWFECTNGDYKITTKTIEQPDETPSTIPVSQSGITAEVICTKNNGCATLTIFDQIDDKLNYLRDAKLSVWRDADGKFNTARLASDSIAGVVLGTAGGVITSKIVKKNQIKNGFEDLKCTIGGQVVATYGDEFTVSVK